MSRVFGIGDFVTFRNPLGSTCEGKIVGREMVTGGDLLKRSPGRWFLVRYASGEGCVQVAESAVGGILEGARA